MRCQKNKVKQTVVSASVFAAEQIKHKIRTAVSSLTLSLKAVKHGSGGVMIWACSVLFGVYFHQNSDEFTLNTKNLNVEHCWLRFSIL